MENTTKQEQQARTPIVINRDVEKLMPDLIWTLKARSNDESRYALSLLNVTDKEICCTDGRRLHLFKGLDRLPALPPGSYSVIVNKDTVIFVPGIDIEFPDYKAVMPQYSNKDEIIIDLSNRKKCDSLKLSSTLARLSIKMQGGKSAVNMEYLKDLIGYSWTVRHAAVEPENKPLHFIAGDNEALIMPIRLDI